MLRRIALTAATVALLGVAPAWGATVSVEQRNVDNGRESPLLTAVTVVGEGVDADDITIALVDGALEVSDAAAGLTPAPLCPAVDAHRVRCAPFARLTVAVDGGDGADRLTFAGGASGSLTGGGGDDVLQGGTGDDVLAGGAGRDELHGGGGHDSFTIDTAGGLTGDMVDGGAPGASTLGVVTDAPGYVLDLAAGTLRGPGNAIDMVSGVTVAVLGPVAGTLLGDDRANQLSGAGTIDGRGGDDKLYGSGGVDRLLGGAGDDQIDVGPGDIADGGAGGDVLRPSAEPVWTAATRATVTCGAGKDRFAQFRWAFTPVDCEQTPLRNDIILAPPVAARRALVVRATISDFACGLEVGARSASTHRAIGATVRMRIRPGQKALRVRVPVRGTTPRTVEIALGYATACPRGKRWTSASPAIGRMVVAGR
jgi:hypothetical protein